jgi:hypothetical protein
MTDWLKTLVAMLAATLALAGCSLQTALDSMTSPEDRQFAQAFVSHLQAGDEAWIRARMDPAQAGAAGNTVKSAGALIPPPPARTRLVGYQVATQTTNGASARTQTFVLATEGAGRWSVTEFTRRASNGGPALVTAWRVTPHTQRPAELVMFDASEKAVPYLWGLGIAFVAVLAAIVVFIVRYRRRRRAQMAGHR